MPAFRVKFRPEPKLLVFLAFLVIAAVVPNLTSSSYLLRVLIGLAVYTMLASQFRLLGSAHVFNMAIIGLMGIGGYTTAILVVKLHWNFWATLPLAGLGAALFSLLLGFLSLRVKRVYFAILSFAFAMVITSAWILLPYRIFGGWFGITNVPRPNPIGPWTFNSLADLYYLALILLAVNILVVWWLDRSRFGLTLYALDQSEALAQSVGVNILRFVLGCCAVTSFLTGVTGAFFGTVATIVSPETFGFFPLLFVLSYSVFGGMRSVWGPVLGAGVLGGLPLILSYTPFYDPMYEPIMVAVFMILVIIFLPGGLASLAPRIQKRYRRYRARKVEHAVT